MDTTRQCSCEGNNERCFRCDGTGFMQIANPAPLPLFPNDIPGLRSDTCRVLPAPNKKRGAQKHAVRITQSDQPPPIMLHLPDLVPAPQHLFRGTFSYSLCEQCRLYILNTRFKRHSEICAHRPDRTRPEPLNRPKPVSAKMSKPDKAKTPTASLVALLGGDRVVPCDLCRSVMRLKNVDHHRQRVHGRGRPLSAYVLPLFMRRGRETLKFCDCCGQYISVANFLVHIAGCAPRAAHIPCQVAPVQAAGMPAAHHAPRSTLTLPANPMKGLHLQQPSANPAYRAVQQATKALEFSAHVQVKTYERKPKSRATGLEARPGTENSALLSMPERSRDASPLTGFYARERGRFGSMASYDDYGDESSAD